MDQVWVRDTPHSVRSVSLEQLQLELLNVGPLVPLSLPQSLRLRSGDARFVRDAHRPCPYSVYYRREPAFAVDGYLADWGTIVWRSLPQATALTLWPWEQGAIAVPVLIVESRPCHSFRHLPHLSARAVVPRGPVGPDCFTLAAGQRCSMAHLAEFAEALGALRVIASQGTQSLGEQIQTHMEREIR